MSDAINRPKHYNTGKFEAIDVIEDWKLGFNLGNTVKYVSRAGKKDPSKHIEDLKKAEYYLKREIANLEKSSSPYTEEDLKLLSKLEVETRHIATGEDYGG